MKCTGAPKLKMKLAKRLFLVTCFLALFVASASFALAFPSNDNACDTCHTTTDVLTLTSNATGTVDATVGVPFDLDLDASNGVGYLKIVSAWSNNDQFSFSVSEVEDDSSDDTDSAAGEIALVLTITPLAAGTHTIEIWVAAASQLSANLLVTVEVAENTDTTITTPTTTTTPTEPTTDPVETWTTLMYLFNAIAAVMLIVFAVIMIKRTK